MEIHAPIPIEFSEEGVPSMKISDFMRHLPWVVNDFLTPGETNRMLITARGMPDFLCLGIRSNPEDWTRRAYPTALSDDEPRPLDVGTGWMVRITDFRNHRPKLLADFLPDVGEFHVTRKGWPAFIVRQASLDGVEMDQTIEYGSVSEWPDPTEEQGHDDG